MGPIEYFSSLSIQARVAIIAALFALAYIFMIFSSSRVSGGYMGLMIYVILYSLIMIFTIECVVNGQCKTWGWVITIVLIFILMGLSTAAKMYIRELEKRADEETDEKAITQTEPEPEQQSVPQVSNFLPFLGVDRERKNNDVGFFYP